MNLKPVLTAVKARGATWVVFGAATYQSFWHSVHVASQHGASDPWLLPISIDGVMIVSFGYASHGKTKTARVLAWIILLTAMAGVVTINYLAAPTGDPIGQGLSVAPALGMIATTILIHLVPKAKTPASRRRTPARKSTNVTPLRKKA